MCVFVVGGNGGVGGGWMDLERKERGETVASPKPFTFTFTVAFTFTVTFTGTLFSIRILL